jgi:hypothetical protein
MVRLLIGIRRSGKIAWQEMIGDGATSPEQEL